jgi:serine protease inhibitor
MTVFELRKSNKTAAEHATCTDLSNHLTITGISVPFGPQADFSGMTGKSELFLSAVFQKAFIEVIFLEV